MSRAVRVWCWASLCAFVADSLAITYIFPWPNHTALGWSLTAVFTASTPGTLWGMLRWPAR